MIGFGALTNWISGLLPLRDWLWLDLVVALVGYHEITVSVAHHTGRTEAQTQCTVDRHQAEVIALHDWIGVDDWLRNAAETQTTMWMLWRAYREHQRERLESDHGHNHVGHDQHGETKHIDTGHGQTVIMEVFEQGVPPRFRLRFESHDKASSPSSGDDISVDTTRPDGSTQRFSFTLKGDYLESVEEIPEPHEFMARLRLSHHDHSHDYDVEFVEHGHTHHDLSVLDVPGAGYQDAHELAHANDIKRRFASREVTTGQIILFGLTGGLVPCPASITVLLLCLQLKQVTLGVVLVLCFSIGLALTMVVSGTIAALSVQHVSKRWTGFATLARRAPYFSSALIILVGLYTGYLGWRGLALPRIGFLSQFGVQLPKLFVELARLFG